MRKEIEIYLNYIKKIDKPESLKKFVENRKGNDYRYAIDSTKIRNELGWYPNIKFEDGIIQTIDWYLNNKDWLR